MNGLMKELFRVDLYKNSQGRIARRLSMVAVAVIFICGAYSLYVNLTSNLSLGLRGLVCGLIAAFGCWFAFRLVNWPSFADFLVSVEAEMMKVSWPSYHETYISTLVVLVVLALLALFIFIYDNIWFVVFRYFFWII